MTVEIVDNPEESRYELLLDGDIIGVELYELDGDVISLVHTEISPAHDHQGYAKQLVEWVLADARRLGRDVLPICPYVRSVIAANLDAYGDLVPQDQRAAFGLKT